MSDLEGLLEDEERDIRPAPAGRCFSKVALGTSVPLLFFGFLALSARVAPLPVRGDRDVALLEVTTTTTPATRDLTTFYMYRAQSDNDYDFENVNAANLAGLLWYLEHEVVFPQCPRHYNITRILRFKVSIKTPVLFQHNFSRFWAFDQGMCTSPECAQDYSRHGFTVGCQYQDASGYPGAVWYSLPGLCPTTLLVAKATCTTMPGGRCARPSGAMDCTWSAEKAGELKLSDVEDVANWTDFCLHHGNEYILPFWDGRGDTAHMKMRMSKVLEMFEAKYPAEPIELKEPLCDWRPPNWRPSLV